MKRVLFITYYWPPAGGPGVYRVVKFAKYLSQFGWTPLILTVRNGEYPEYDESLIQDIPSDAKTIRTSKIEPFSIYKRLTGKSSKSSIPAGYLGQSGKKSVLENLSRTIRMNLFLPDARIGWLPFARNAIKRLNKTWKPDIILTSSPPQTVQLIGLQAKKKLNVPWIADFRDPWTDIYYYEHGRRAKWAEAVDRWLEKKVLTTVDHITSVSDEIVGLLTEKVDREVSSTIIPNGYDPDDFRKVIDVNRERFVLAHIGKLSSTQPVSNLVKAIEQVLRNRPETQKNLLIRCIGTVMEPAGSILQSQLHNNVSVEQYKPHSEVILDMQEASVLFLIIPETENNAGILTGKLFDYIGSTRPILAIGPKDGAAARVIRDLRLAEIFDYNEIPEMVEWICAIYDLWKRGDKLSEPNNKIRDKYSRRIQAKALAERMNFLTTN